jgi:prepilin-type N-terminal cleavage/methylation domain-containing protein
MKKKYINAFTLVELSIVLVIIGMIMGAIAAGNNLVKNAKVRAVISEVTEFRVAVNSFKNQYDQIPGDYNKAGFTWPTCDASGGNSAANCNGNGNNKIDQNTTGYVNDEMYRFWQHLVLAKMLQGGYSGIEVGRGQETTAVNNNLNTPTSRFGDGGAYYLSWAIPAGSSIYNNYFVLGRLVSGQATTAITTAAATQYIDSKIDDGLPYTGNTLSQNGLSAPGNCTTGSGITMTYNTNDQNVNCDIFFNIFN